MLINSLKAASYKCLLDDCSKNVKTKQHQVSCTTCQARSHKLCININNKQYQEISKQNIPYMYLQCQSNTFPFFDQLNSDVSLINSNFINFRFSHDKNIFVDENLKTFLQSVIIETLFNDSDHSVSIDSKYHDIKDFNKLNINKNSSFATLNLNIVSLF